MATQTPQNTQATRRTEFERAIDRSLEGAGRFFRERWRLIVAALVALAALAALCALIALVVVELRQRPAHPWTALVFAVVAIVLTGAALLWFQARPRIHWVLPTKAGAAGVADSAGASLDDYQGAPEVVAAARRIVALLRGARGMEQAGGEISQGLLLIGPPGVGKRYLAERICAEAGAPLATLSSARLGGLSLSMDALMIRSLYRKARRLARAYGACVIFVDELDAIGAARGALNELLMQLDMPPAGASRWRRMLRMVGLTRGDVTPGTVLTIGATSARAALAPALLRPGRLDRAISLTASSDAQRAEVIERSLSHVRHDDIALPRLVAVMAGYTPLAIQRAIAEAAMIAHADGRESISYQDVVAARETHANDARYPHTLSPLEQRRLAYHTAGRAVAQAYLSPRVRVAHVTMMRRLSHAGGADVETQPLEEVATQSADEVFASIEVALASRAAEEIFLQARLDVAERDLASATELALRAVARWGMGDTLFSAASLPTERLHTDPELRAQAERLLRQSYNAVCALLERRNKAVIAVAEALLEHEDLEGDEFALILHRAETPTHAEMTALASVAEAALFGAPAAIDFQAPAPHLIGPVAPGAPADERPDSAGAAEQTPQTAPAPRRTAPRPPGASGPSAFAASPSQELRADRVVDRAILRAPLRQTILRKTDPNLPAVTSANGAGGAGGAGGD